MSQDLQSRLLSLEKSARRWKVLALSSWGLLGLLLLLCFGLAIYQVTALRAAAAREMEAALVAREAAEQERQARQDAERARQEAEKKQREAEQARKKAEKTSMRQMYQAHILLAQREWERRNSPRPGGMP